MVSLRYGRTALTTLFNFFSPSSRHLKLSKGAQQYSTTKFTSLTTSTSSSSVKSRRLLSSLVPPLIGFGLATQPHNHNRQVNSNVVLCAASSSSSDMNSNTFESEDSVEDPIEKLTGGYLEASRAYDLDVDLMTQPGFSLEQLMELAGLSVAEAVYQILQDTSTSSTSSAAVTQQNNNKNKKKILILCGPGNNGGDGLVAARHLFHFGFDNEEIVIVYPKRSKGQHFVNLVAQCENLGIPVVDEIPLADDGDENWSVIVDAIFGFSFKGEPREPLASILYKMIDLQKQSVNKKGISSSSSSVPVVVVSVDVPSGWNVNEGDVTNLGFTPDVLISLTAPKLCSKDFQGRHFIGGRFLPPALAEKYGIKMPPYPGTSQVMEVPTLYQQKQKRQKEMEKENDEDENDWTLEYQRYLDEKEAESSSDTDKAQKEETDDNNNNDDDDGVEDWARQYQEYCIQKEEELAKKDQERLEKMKRAFQEEGEREGTG